MAESGSQESSWVDRNVQRSACFLDMKYQTCSLTTSIIIYCAEQLFPYKKCNLWSALKRMQSMIVKFQYAVCFFHLRLRDLMPMNYSSVKELLISLTKTLSSNYHVYEDKLLHWMRQLTMCSLLDPPPWWRAVM